MVYTKSPPIVEQVQTWICKDMVESQNQTQAFDTAQKVLFLFLSLIIIM